MDESDQASGVADYGRDEGFEGGSGRAFIAVIVATAVLYFGKDILLPLAMASILAVAFSPIASHLEPLVGRFVGAALVVLMAIGVLGATGYFLMLELTSVAVDVAGYSDNIATKLSTLEGSTPTWLQRIEDGVKDVQQQLEKKAPIAQGRTSRAVQAQPAPPGVKEVLQPALPILSGIGESLLVIVLFFFLLYGRKDLRDRFVRLAARARIIIAAEAIETAGGTVGRYLLFLSLTNLGYGIAIGMVAWVLGLPNAAFWGALAFLLRFIPYVGALASAMLPTLVAFAIFPGWRRSFEVLGSFVILDQAAAQLVEPFLIGRGVGVSPVALLVSAMYWVWLWGLPGLFLATPLTACLKVAGDYIPELGFFAILLGGDKGIEDYNDYYRMLLELDRSRAHTLATHYCDEHGLESTFDDVLIPAIVLAGQERFDNNISHENQELIVETTRDLVMELGNRFIKPRTKPRLRILGMCAPGEVHNLGLLMLLELIRHAGAAANLVDDKSPDEIRDFVKRYAPDMVCLSCTMTQCLPAAVELVRGLRQDSPGLAIVGGGAAALSSPAELLEAGCSQICATRSDARRVIRRFALQRARSRSLGIIPSLPGLNPQASTQESSAASTGDPKPPS
jgi:predicted PurR-regulated permease PerM/methanogenic corrinoid protein MtbC1